MPTREYFCIRYPRLQIGRHIRFKLAKFTTDDPKLQKELEDHEWFGVFIRVKEDGSESKRRVSPLQQNDRKAPRPRKKVKRSSSKTGRKKSSVLQTHEGQEEVNPKEAVEDLTDGDI